MSCKDSEDKFLIKALGEEKGCWWASNGEGRCDLKIVQTNCPETCNLCNTGNTTPTTSECEDIVDRFYIQSIDASKYCSWAANLVEERCDIAEVKTNCPQTCSLCNTGPAFQVGPISISQQVLEIGVVAAVVVIMCALSCCTSGGGGNHSSRYEDEESAYYERQKRRRARKVRDTYGEDDDCEEDYRPRSRSGGRKSRGRRGY